MTLNNLIAALVAILLGVWMIVAWHPKCGPGLRAVFGTDKLWHCVATRP